MSLTVEYQVTGMNCEHCVQAVTAKVTAVSGVEHVEIDLPTGTMRVSGHEAVPFDHVLAAVDDAGFQVTARP